MFVYTCTYYKIAMIQHSHAVYSANKAPRTKRNQPVSLLAFVYCRVTKAFLIYSFNDTWKRNRLFRLQFNEDSVSMVHGWMNQRFFHVICKDFDVNMAEESYDELIWQYKTGATNIFKAPWDQFVICDRCVCKKLTWLNFYASYQYRRIKFCTIMQWQMVTVSFLKNWQK